MVDFQNEQPPRPRRHRRERDPRGRRHKIYDPIK